MKKTIFKISLFIFLPILLILSGCMKAGGKCEESGDAYSTGFFFRLVNPNTGESVIDALKGKYNPDSTRLVKSDGTAANSLKIQSGGQVSLNLMDNPDEIMNTEISKTFYLVLQDRRGNEDIDTLNFVYSIMPNECSESVFDKLSAHFNGKLIYSGVYVSSLTFTKK